MPDDWMAALKAKLDAAAAEYEKRTEDYIGSFVKDYQELYQTTLNAFAGSKASVQEFKSVIQYSGSQGVVKELPLKGCVIRFLQRTLQMSPQLQTLTTGAYRGFVQFGASKNLVSVPGNALFYSDLKEGGRGWIIPMTTTSGGEITVYRRITVADLPKIFDDALLS